MEISKVKKRNGQIVSFSRDKIRNVIYKAFLSVGKNGLVDKITEEVISELETKKGIIKVEEIQDIVEHILIKNNLPEIAKSYILYRKKMEEIREEKERILNKEEIDDVDKKFDLNALRVLVARYLEKDSKGKTKESPKDLFKRVAIHVTLPSILYDEKIFDKSAQSKENLYEEFNPEQSEGKIKIGEYLLNRYHLKALKRLYDRFNKNKQMKISFTELIGLIENGKFEEYRNEIKYYFNLMTEKKFLPNTPALANFGRVLGMGSACFVVPVEDSIESIMEALKEAAVIFKSGGGVGYNFSHLRPEGDQVRSTSGVASGPISFISLFDKMTDVIKQGGIRRGANMGILDIDHPDIEKFIVAKKKNQGLTNFNISVFIKPEFWEYYNTGKPYPLLNPKTKEIVKYVDPRNLIELITYQGWESAEPGVIFGDNINNNNPFLESLGPIETTNPCGEVLLYPYESCNLGSINLSRFIKEGEKPEFDFESFREVVHRTTRFLDNVIDINNYPLSKIEEMSLNTRKIGLGIMGLADAMFELGIAYNSEEGLEFIEKIMEELNYHSKVTSVELAKERGNFLYYEKSNYSEGKLPIEVDENDAKWKELIEDIKKYGIRHGFTIVCAPTGSISMIAGCSSGVEPSFALVYEKKVVIGTFYYINPVFEKIMKSKNLFNDKLIKNICENNGSIQELDLPDEIKKTFVTATDINTEGHIKALAAVTRWTDASVSKTINLPENASVEDVKNTILMAHKLGCKDVTVFRQNSIKGVYESNPEPKKETSSYEATKKEDLCPKCKTKLVREEGCKVCKNCGYSVCG